MPHLSWVVAAMMAHLFIFVVASLQHTPFASNGSSEEFEPDLSKSELEKRDDKPFYLRIAPLGASITNGYLSSDGNGYRKHLRDRLRVDGWPVNMVGSLNSGNMNDNQNEGHLGWVIDQVAQTAVPNIAKYQPNLVLINVGTNDAGQNIDIPGAADRMINLLDQLWSSIPDATVILSTLLANKNSDNNARGDTISQEYRTTIIRHYTGQGKKITLADMNDGFITTADLNDDTHPTDFGYEKMASVWYAAFQTVVEAGWLTAPPDTGIPDNSTSSSTQPYTCPKVYGNGRGNIQIQKGSGTDDGNYVHSSQDQGRVFTFPFYSAGEGDDGGFDLNAVHFAQLVNAGGNPNRGGEVDEIILVVDNGNDTYRYSYWTNNNNNNFGDRIDFEPRIICAPDNVRFADFNNNGLDDFVCLSYNGDMFVSLNRGGNPPTFELVLERVMTAPDGYTPDLVYLADIDGDGRADYCLLSHSSPGDVICQRNGGSGDLPIEKYGGFWQDFSSGGVSFTTVFPSQHRNNAAGVNLVDINGDFKTDWLFMDQTGHVDTFINNRGTGFGMVPDWRSAGATHGGLASFNVTDANSRVKFGRMYGTGRRDYIWIERELISSKANSYRHHLHIWKNLGSGGTYLKGDGSRYCDMTGDGTDDYVWVGPNGLIDIYVNYQNPPLWHNYGSVINLGVPRKEIHIADLDGDGKCDFLHVEKSSGVVRMWQNTYDGTSWSFVDRGIVSDTARCTQGYGVIENDLGVRFADLTADKKADYLCIEPNGRVTGFLNRGMTSSGQVNFEDVGQIKLATNYDRQNVRFNDVNGDGKADLLWISKYIGDTTVWYNAGEHPTSGSHFEWDKQGVLYKAWDRGSNMNFGALGGQGRADIIQVIPRSNIAYVSYNECPVVGPGGDDPVTNGNLVSYEGHEGQTVWDFAPDFSQDSAPPYPDLKNPDGSNVTIANLRGTHLFGWKGCTADREKVIATAYSDFYKLSNIPAVYNNIAWTAQSATDFWGPASGDFTIPDDTRKEIQQIFAAAQQVYSYPWTWQPPWLSFRQLWIEVRCSDGKQGDGQADPENTCGDAQPNDGNCPGGAPPRGGADNKLQAFSDPEPSDSRYSRITFCDGFFKLQSLGVTEENVRRQPARVQNDLTKWDNHARVFFHEVTHLDYFMNADGKSPFVSDLEVEYTTKGQADWHDAYGPYNAKILRNWEDPDPQYSGYFTQRNADNYAFFALAKYVEQQIGSYPTSPSPGRKKPVSEPQDAQTHKPPLSNGPGPVGTTSVDGVQIDGDEQDNTFDVPYPGCGDKVDP